MFNVFFYFFPIFYFLRLKLSSEGRKTTCGYHQLIILTQVWVGNSQLKDIISRRPSLNTNTGCWRIYLLFA